VTVYDISILVGESTPEWPGDTPFSCGWTARVSDGQSVNLSAITMSPHVGSHADAPLHVRDGHAASDALPLDAFLGAAFVLGVEGPPRDLDADEILPRLPLGTTRVLLRTGVSVAGGSFPTDWPALTVAAAQSVAASGIILLGVDAPSVDRRTSKSLGVHHALFGGGAWVLENLDLSGVDDGIYELVAPPLRVAGLDAAPVRALLRPLAAPSAGR
jgi:arylformamidase